MNSERPLEFWELPIEEQVLLQEEQLNAQTEFSRIVHLEKYGPAPKYGIPLIDAFADVGCPCWQCLRDEFL